MLVSGFAQAATYYVSTSGSDSNPGSQSAPFQHVSYGAAAARAGDTVIVMDGTYDNEGQVADSSGGGSVVTLTNSGAPGSPITIMAQNRGGAVLNAASSAQSSLGCYGAWAYFDVSYASYVVIQGFVIENACINGVHANGSAHDITLRWNEIKNIGNWSNPASTLSPSGIYLNRNEYNFTFDGNSFHDIGGGSNVNQQHAIYTQANNITIVNNIFYNQMHGWDIQTSGGTNVYIANNTFAFPNPNRAGHIILWDDAITNSLSNIVIENNIFYQPLSYAVVAELDGGGSIGGCNLQNNLTTAGSAFDNGSTFGGGGVNCAQSSNVTGTDPAFVNASGMDFHLQAGSAAIGSGMVVPYTTVDFTGAARPANAAYDLGAYEYQAIGPPPPPPPPPGPGDYTTGLVGEWKLAGDAADSASGNGGALAGGALWGSDLVQGVSLTDLYLNGSDAYVSIPEAPQLEMNSQLTVSFWLQSAPVPSSSDSDPRVIAKLYDWDVKLNGNQYPQFSSGGSYAMTNYALPLNTWAHVVFTFSSGSVNAYINGQPVGLQANTFGAGAALPAYAYGLYLGTDSSATYFFSGALSDVRIYNRALSAADVAALYSSVAP